MTGDLSQHVIERRCKGNLISKHIVLMTSILIIILLLCLVFPFHRHNELASVCTSMDSPLQFFVSYSSLSLFCSFRMILLIQQLQTNWLNDLDENFPSSGMFYLWREFENQKIHYLMRSPFLRMRGIKEEGIRRWILDELDRTIDFCWDCQRKRTHDNRNEERDGLNEKG